MSESPHAISSNWASNPKVTTPANQGMTADHDEWKTIHQELLYDGDHAKLYHETVITPTRPDAITWTVVRRKAAVVIAPLTVDGNWLLIRQERVAVRQTIWEFPAGQIESRVGDSRDYQEIVRETAWRELREETGHHASPQSKLTSLGLFFPSVGFTDEHSHLFLADHLVPHEEGAAHDEAESIVECQAFSTSELTRMIAEGEIRDANTLSTFARLVALKKL